MQQLHNNTADSVACLVCRSWMKLQIASLRHSTLVTATLLFPESQQRPNKPELQLRRSNPQRTPRCLDSYIMCTRNMEYWQHCLICCATMGHCNNECLTAAWCEGSLSGVSRCYRGSQSHRSPHNKVFHTCMSDSVANTAMHPCQPVTKQSAACLYTQHLPMYICCGIQHLMHDQL